MKPYDRRLKPLARRLRGDMTDAEERLWHQVRRKQILGVQFYRQKPIGPYIVDFYAPRAGLVIEVDGSQHLADEEKARDAVRDSYLASVGLCVMRFDDRAVLVETEAVLERVYQAVTAGLRKRGLDAGSG